MITLVLAMIAARRAQAVTLWLLSIVVTAAAVAGPVALREVDQAIVRSEVGAATNTERSLSVTAFVNPSAPNEATQFDTIAALVSLPGFDPIRAGELEAFGPVKETASSYSDRTSRIVYRDRVCEHLRLVEGRCATGPLEVVIGTDTARVNGLAPGAVTIVQAARYVVGRGLIPDGVEARLTVVGVYRPIDPDEVYWAGQRYFPVLADGTRQEALFVTVPTFDAVDHSLGQSSVDSIAPLGVLTVDRLAGLSAEVGAVTATLGEQHELAVDTDLPALAERVQRSRDAARELVPVAFLPLVALCFFVIFLAVGYAAFGRRPELGVVALRGVTPVRRWWLATGETVLVILAGAPVGYLVGYLAVALVARVGLGGSAVPPDLAAVPYALLALASALVVALLGLRRAAQEPVADLLRGVPARGGRWRSIVIEVLVVVLAVLGIVQLRATAGLRGVALIVPGLVVAAVVLVAARAVTPLAGLVTRWSLRQGRLGLGLAAVQLARRPGSQRLFVLVAVAAAMLSFVSAGLDVAARAREDRARIVTGAPTVLTVEQGDVRRLLHVTRTVDPTGAWAMGVMSLDQSFPDAPRVLAIDSSRLGAVAAWRPEFGEAAAAVSAALRPPPGQPFIFRGRQLVLDLSTERQPREPLFDLTVTLAPLVGGDVISVAVAELAAGRSTRRVNVSGCTDGCRLTGLSVSLPRGDTLRLSIYGIAQADPPGVVVPPAALVQRSRWRAAESVRVVPTGNVLQIAASPSAFDSGQVDVAAIDAPLPVPIVSTRELADNSAIDSVDGSPILATVVESPAMLPRVGMAGAFVDLEYLERTALFAPRRAQAEVWLGPKAPADAAELLRRAGLAVSRSTGIDANEAALDRQGPALALRFHLAAAVFGIGLALGGLALVAAVDRRRRAEDLRALRRQGLAQRDVDQAALGGYLAIVVLAAAAGLAAAGVAWLASGDRLPVFTDSLDAVRPPRWPGAWAVLAPWLTATLVMVVGSGLAAWALRRVVGPELRRGRSRE